MKDATRCWHVLLGLGAIVAVGCTPGEGKAQSGAQGAPSASSTLKPIAMPKAEDWNDTQVQWMGYDDGLAAAKAEKKPVCLVFFTTWCPHCKNFSHIFSDPRVVEQAKTFVMIRLDKDKNAEISKRYAMDGEYIPRTFFLKADGTLDESIHAPRDKFKYFYDEQRADSLLASMTQASAKLR